MQHKSIHSCSIGVSWNKQTRVVTIYVTISHIWKVKNNDIYYFLQKTTYEQFIIRVDGHAPAFDELYVFWYKMFNKKQLFKSTMYVDMKVDI